MTTSPPPLSSTQPVDLTNCDREPIHQLGRIQSYGALLAVSSDWLVQHASENLPDILGVAVDEALGRPLHELIVSDGFDRIRSSLRLVNALDTVTRLFGVALKATGRSYDICVHQSGEMLIVEFEPKVDASPRDPLTEVYPHIATLRKNDDLRHLTRDAARALHALSGFDSVMVYQFQPDNSGKVVAEYRADGRKRYDGMMFPASDIPVQARALYTRSLLRLISDVNDPGEPVVPGVSMMGEPLDLSLAVTRAVSPIHIEYLKNMGVQASMSVSIMKDGKLWGLFACHHDIPRYIDYERRTAIEMFAHMFSYELINFEERARKVTEEATRRLQTQLMAHLANGSSLDKSLLSVSEEIRNIIPHDGLMLYENEELRTAGDVPSEEQFREICRMLDRGASTGVFSTDRLSKFLESAQDYQDRFAGIMAIPISKRPRDYLVLVRRPVSETIDWAGDPTKPVSFGPNGTRLTPRKSFDVWKEDVRGRSAPWTPQEVHAAELLRTVLLEVFLKITDATNLERKRAQEQQSLLISELNHRVRNILNLMRGLLSQSASGAKSMEELTANLDGRIQALARAHDQLTSEQWEPTSLKTLIRTELEAFADRKSDRMEVTGPDAMISPQAFTTMALVIHEMTTNSIKYGALCDSSGRVLVTTKVDASGGFLIHWKEVGGPPVAPPKRRGFGSTIIENSVPHELRGDAEISYKMTGVEAHFRLPPSVIAAVRKEGETVSSNDLPSQSDSAYKISGKGMVLEDTLIIAMDAADILSDLGASDVKIVSSVDAAMSYLNTTQVSFALLDVNLGDEQSLPVAERLAASGVPFVLATGYGAAEELVEAYPDGVVIVQKPFSQSALEGAFEKAFAKRGRI
ncbi:HWE histidine kinase domain-containing protein [Sagittula marina]|uniref:HWE histidine kinase domain-containing protein n=1 Tax=Sagittula marina TaxID=943940 RepID=UPI00160F3F5B|nr:HWE histidine kinase domain-containing protein [Sagittula marina]